MARQIARAADMYDVARYKRSVLVLAALVIAAAGSVKFWYGHTASRLLTSVEQVRSLSVDAAREGHSVCIRGTVVYRGLDYFILADGTGALRFEAPGAVVLLKAGWDLFEARGITDSDGTSAIIRRTEYTAVANGPAALVRAATIPRFLPETSRINSSKSPVDSPRKTVTTFARTWKLTWKEPTSASNCPFPARHGGNVCDT